MTRPHRIVVGLHPAWAVKIMIYEYKVGMRVRDQYDRDYLGEVVEVMDEDKIHVRWDLQLDEVQRHDPCEIRPYDPVGDKIVAQKAQRKVDEATTLLESAFQAWREAQEIYAGYSSEGAGGELCRSEEVDTSKFEGTVEGFGWSTSSLHC